jgi:hypothetical protein
MIAHAGAVVSRFSDLKGKAATIDVVGNADGGTSGTSRDRGRIADFGGKAAGRGLLSGPMHGFTARVDQAA